MPSHTDLPTIWPSSVADLAATIAELLDEAASATGDVRFAVAAGHVRGRRGGRPKINDADALAEMAHEIEQRRATGIDDAARLVGATLRTGNSSEAIAKRLARKYRALTKNK